MYNFNHLYYFYATVKFGGVTASAQQLKISQPSLSSQLKTLERALDVRLFRRVGRNNVLTEAGGAVYGFCRQMFETAEELGDYLAKEASTVSRRIHIGVSHEVDRPFVADIVSRFLRKHAPDARPKVFVVSGEREKLFERLKFRELDVVVTEQAVSDPDLRNIERAEVPVVLACPRGWKPGSDTSRLSAREAMGKVRDVQNVQWVMPSGRFKLRAEIDRFFEDNQLTGKVVFESDVMASLVRSVSDGIGLSFLPLLYVSREIGEKSLRVLGPEDGYWKYRVWLASHRRMEHDPVIRTLAESFAQVCQSAY